LLVFLLPILGMALGVGVMFLLGLNGTDYENLIVNLFFLVSVIGLIRLFKFSSEDLGLKVIKEKMQGHVVLSFAILIFYMLFYVFVIHISRPKPFSSGTLWGLVTYLIVVIAEELYFRGALYSFFEQRFSAKTALIVSSILFGIFHAQQGLRGIISRTITGWLWGSVRYTTGMIYLLIIPVHFAYNVTWLLFEGNWDAPPGWAAFAVSIGELLLTILILAINHFRKSST